MKKLANVCGMSRGNLGILRIFWLVAMFLMVGGQVLHVVEDFQSAHEICDPACSPDHENCPPDDSCCQVQVHMLTALLEDFRLPCFPTMTGRLFPDDSRCLEGPVRKIDHPPQLS